MERPERNVRIQVDGYTRVCLTAIAVLLTLTVIGLWSDRGPSVGQAGAGVVSAKSINRDTSADAVEPKPNIQVSSTAGLRDEMEKVGARMQELQALLRSGEVKVQVVKPEKGDKPEKSEKGEKSDKAEKAEGEKDGSE